MNYKLISILTFAAGAALGSAVTWKLLRTKYERIAQEEIESVKEVYSRRKPTINECVEEIANQVDSLTNNAVDKPDIMEYANRIKDLGYSEETKNNTVKTPVMEEEDMIEPYEISSEEFDTLDDYECETLTYYADGVLTDYYDEIIEDVSEVVGEDALKRFEEEEDVDYIYIRNDVLQHDYEILRDYRKYSEVIDSHSTED